MIKGKYPQHNHQYGFCFSWSNLDYYYIPLPKRASQFTEAVLKNSFGELFVENNFNIDKSLLSKKAIIVMRDPIEGYLSGVSEYLYRNCKNYSLDLETIDLIFTQLLFDEHTDIATNFLNGLNVQNCIFFDFNNNFTDTLKHFLIYDCSTKFEYPKLSDYNHKDMTAKTFYNKLKKAYENSIKYQNNVKNYLQLDIELYNSIEFYTSK